MAPVDVFHVVRLRMNFCHFFRLLSITEYGKKNEMWYRSQVKVTADLKPTSKVLRSFQISQVTGDLNAGDLKPFFDQIVITF